MATNRRTKKVEAGVRDLPMKQSAAEMVNGGVTATGEHYPNVTISDVRGGSPGLVTLVSVGALCAGAGAAK